MSTFADIIREKKEVKRILQQIENNISELECIAETNGDFLIPILRESRKLRISLTSTGWNLEEIKTAVLRDIDRLKYIKKEKLHER